MLQEILKNIGFSEKEIAIYSVILENGRISYTDIAKKTSMNRTTVYSVAKDLLMRGVIQEDLASPVKALVAAPPESLAVTTSAEEKILKEKMVLISKAIEDIRSMPSISHYVAPAITFIPEKRIATHLRERNDEWNRNILASDRTWWGFQDTSFVSEFGEWIAWYWQHAPNDIVLRLFSNNTTIERTMQTQTPSRREIRFWKGEQAFTGTLWVIGDTVITINTREHPFSLVETRDKILAQNLRTVFMTLWNQ